MAVVMADSEQPQASLDFLTSRSVSPLSRGSSTQSSVVHDSQFSREPKQSQNETSPLRNRQFIPRAVNIKSKADVAPQKASRRQRAHSRWSHRATDWWLWELCSLLCSVISLVAIVLVLRLHEGRPLPQWPFSITINSLVSVFATIFSATISVPVAEGISQAKWQWFQQYHTLEDIEVYDRASRGPWGAVKMLWSIRWR